MNPLIRSRLACWVDAGKRLAAVSVVQIEGSTPHALGLAMVVNSSGEIAGAVSGGCVDGAIVEACDDVLRSGRSRAMMFAADGGEFGEAGLICGGNILVWIYELDGATIRTLLDSRAESSLTLRGHPQQGPSRVLAGMASSSGNKERTTLRQFAAEDWEFEEFFGQRSLVLIIGQSGFTNSLAALGRLLGHEVVVCEPRPRFASAVTEADRVVLDLPERCIDQLAKEGRLDAHSAVIICTHDRKFDQPALLAAVRSQAGFVGAMGSRKTVDERRRRLLDAGMSAAECARIHSPLGLDLRAETPAETAVSVFAQWIASRHGGTGVALNQMEGSIHARP